MKKMKNKAIVVLGAAILAFSACKKDAVQLATNSSSNDITALSDQAESEIANVDIQNLDPALGIFMETEGIAVDYTVIASDLESDDVVSRTNRSDSDFAAAVHSRSFIVCVRAAKLDSTQKRAVVKALKAYEECKGAAMKRARAIYANLKLQYRDSVENLMKDLKAGNISKADFAAGMHRLRVEFRKDLMDMHIREKLNIAFRNCYRDFLATLKSIMTADQWAAFVKCHKR